MSALGWYMIFTGINAGIVLIACIAVRRFGCFVERAEQTVQTGENVAIQLRSCVIWLHDLAGERHRDHPVIPPDAFPDAVQEKEVA